MDTNLYIQDRIHHLECMERAGDPVSTEMVEALLSGSAVILWRRFRATGDETYEILSPWLAKATLATIPEREPLVARARIIRENTT